MLNRRRLIKAGTIPPPQKFDQSRFGAARGQAIPEFAMVTGLFLLLLFAIVDYGWFFFAQMNIQQAVDDGGRYASTGQESGGSGTRISSIQNVILGEISIPSVNASDIKICSSLSGCNTSSSPNAGAAGGPEDTVTVTLTAPMQALMPLNFLGTFLPSANYTYVATATFKNEPFDPSTTK
jgi:Flp pilus assembly protein TadG